MKEVIRIDQVKKDNDKPVVFTHLLYGSRGWGSCSTKPTDSNIESIIYLGNCSNHGDMFSVYYSSGSISIFKGHLNSGKY